MEIHHIVQTSESGLDKFENAIALCFDCHGDQRSYDHKHPKGSKYTRQELLEHRDQWYKRVASSPAIEYGESAKQADKLLYDEVLAMLPWDGAVRFARQHSFSSPFRRDALDQLYEFRDHLENPAFEFLDADLESLRAQLATAVIDFLEAVEVNTFVVEDHPAHQAVPRAWRSFQRDVFHEAVRTLHRESVAMGLAHDALTKAGRRKLLS